MIKDPFRDVVNLSYKTFTKTEFELLNKVLNICPRPNKYNKKQFDNDLLDIFQRLKL